jgi:cbb3-type cytochrome oxidase subunit 3
VSKLLTILKVLAIDFAFNVAGLLPMLLVLDFAMDIQLMRDYGFTDVLLFFVSLVFYANIYAVYIYRRRHSKRFGN